MKKMILLCSLLACTLIFTACGNDRELVCYEELNGGEFKQSLIVNYNKEKTKVESTSIEIKVNINEIPLTTFGCSEETKEECIDDLEAKYKAGCDNMLENCEINDKNDSGFTFTADVKEDKLEEYYSEISSTLPMNQMKSKLEIKYGLTCE